MCHQKTCNDHNPSIKTLSNRSIYQQFNISKFNLLLDERISWLALLELYLIWKHSHRNNRYRILTLVDRFGIPMTNIICYEKERFLQSSFAMITVQLTVNLIVYISSNYSVVHQKCQMHLYKNRELSAGKSW